MKGDETGPTPSHALSDGQGAVLAGDLARPVGELVRRSVVALALEAGDGSAPLVTLRDAALAMESAAVSSVLLTAAGRLEGILTDRDLRRAVADGLDPETPVRRVMTSPVECLDAAVSAADALLRLLRSGRHHLVLTSGDAVAPLGVVTHSDLLRRQIDTPGALLGAIQSLERAEDLGDYAERVARTVATLHRSGLDALQIGRVVAALHDALTSRLLARAEEELADEFGPPPSSYAWIVFGSEGRREQTFVTDQDHALVFGDDDGANDQVHDAYFRRLASRATESLRTVGFPPCPGGFEATNWCLPLGEWTRRFRRWIEEPEPENLLRVGIFFDWRTAHGGLSLEPLEDIVRGARSNRRFLGQMARATTQLRPPAAFFRSFPRLLRGVRNLGRPGSRSDAIDLKAGALLPLQSLVRLYALEAGERGPATVDRLEGAARAGVLSRDGADALIDSFRFVFGLRMRRQLADLAAGRPVSLRVGTGDLSSLDRRRLREALATVDRMQSAAAQRYETDLLG